MKNISLIFIVCLVFSAGASAKINSGAGTSGANFLKIPADSSVQSLGGANYSYPRYASGIFTNPALMNSLTRPALSIDGSRWIGRSHSGSVAYVYPVKEEQSGSTPNNKTKPGRRSLVQEKHLRYDEKTKTAFGVGILYFNPGDIYETRLNEFYQVVETGNKLDAGDFCLAAGYSRAFKHFNAGVSVKYIHSVLDAHTARAYALDIGLHREFELNAGALYCGLAAQNIGTKLDYISETPHKDKLPAVYGLGLGYKYKKSLGLLNAAKPADNDLELSAGFSYEAVEDFCLRLGYRIIDSSKSAIGSSITGFSMGFGFPLKTLGGDLGYSYAPYNKLGNSHHITFNFFFGHQADYEDFVFQ